MGSSWTILVGIALLACGVVAGWAFGRRQRADAPGLTPAALPPPPVAAAAPTQPPTPRRQDGARRTTMVVGQASAARGPYATPPSATPASYDPDDEDEDDLPTTLHLREDDPAEDGLAEVDTGFYQR
jgi:hypothetical protein